jgi:hypothetical protein
VESGEFAAVLPAFRDNMDEVESLPRAGRGRFRDDMGEVERLSTLRDDMSRVENKGRKLVGARFRDGMSRVERTCQELVAGFATTQIRWKGSIIYTDGARLFSAPKLTLL